MPAKTARSVSNGTVTSAVSVPAALPDQLFHQAPLPGNMLPDELLGLPDRRLLGHQPQLVFLQYHDNFVAGVQTERLPVGRRYDEPPPVPIRALVSSTIHLADNMAHWRRGIPEMSYIPQGLSVVGHGTSGAVSISLIRPSRRGRSGPIARKGVPFCAILCRSYLGDGALDRGMAHRVCHSSYLRRHTAWMAHLCSAASGPWARERARTICWRVFVTDTE